MAEYKIDLSFGSEGVVHLHVFDLDDLEPGPIETCEVGEDLNTEALRRAWSRFYDGFETPDTGEYLEENQDADEL
ncbi:MULTISPECIES: hypothetical protein [Haloarcula]|uniref:hypothetical protein n=1 Tax=Haloarcula TaxID=2237 RepID=UPI0023EB5B88|nr:hypothetical protein [Halomicroarcula sp. XH51]